MIKNSKNTNKKNTTFLPESRTQRWEGVEDGSLRSRKVGGEHLVAPSLPNALKGDI